MSNPKKLPSDRQGHAGTKDVTLRKDQPPTPLPPRGLLKRSRERWRGYWNSQVARAVDPVADLHLVERWIKAVDEYERVLPVFEKTRLVKGSMGQLVMNPLAAYLQQVKGELSKCETELGLTPMARLRLGLVAAQGQLTVEELNRRLSAPRPVESESLLLTDGSVVEAWESEWEEA